MTSDAYPPARRRAIGLTLVVFVLLAAANFGIGWIRNGNLWFGPVGAVALLAIAHRSGLDWRQLGLAPDRLRSGAAWAAGAIAVFGLIYLAAVLLPPTRSLFLDPRYHFSVGGALLSAFVIIPLGTVLFEEVAFRSVLWASVARHASSRTVLVVTSVLFGSWHAPGVLRAAAVNHGGLGEALSGSALWSTLASLLGIIAITTAGGFVLGLLRRRSRSLLASMGMHWGTNGLAVLFELLAWKLGK